MAKPRFFIGRQVKYAVDITGADARHVKDVLRLVPGDIIEVVDPDGNLAEVEITNIYKDRISGKVINRRQIKEKLPEVFLFQALPKATKMDDIVRQTTEVGVTGLFPILTERVVVKIDPEKAKKKVERWQKIAAEAAKQSHRSLIPKVSPVLDWQDVLEKLKSFDQVIVFWEEESNRLPYEVIDPRAGRIAIVIGPEGGLAQWEVSDLKKLGAEVVTLGESILRVETAAPVALALVLYDLRKMGKKER